MLKRSLELQTPAIDLSQVIVRGRLPRVIPACLVECPRCFFETFLILQRKPEIVICIAICGVRITPRQPLNCAPKVRFGFAELPAFELQQPQGGVTPAIKRIAFQSFFPVRLWIACGMSVLLQMQASDVQLIARNNFLWKRRLGSGFREGRCCAPDFWWSETDDLLPPARK